MIADGMNARVAAKRMAESLDDLRSSRRAYEGEMGKAHILADVQVCRSQEKQPEVHRQLEQLDVEVALLSERTGIHIDRLGFVLDLTPRGCAEDPNKADRMIASELAQRLHILAERVCAIRERLEMADSSLEI